MTSDDDDRTVIRPSSPPGPSPAATPAEDKTIVVGAPLAIEKTQLTGAPPPSAMDHGNGLAMGTYLGEFELTQMVGEGGFGIVYLAYDHSLHRRVALKEYMPSSLAARTSATHVQVKSERYRETFEAGLKSFINEARLLASFDHPSLVKVYRFWEANGTAYMVMPFLEGVTLKDKLREMGEAPDEAWMRSLLGPVTEALVVIHAEQCYHRDIAPDNVMWLPNVNRWLLLDFGAARRVIGDMTQALTVILKPGYAPVEQYAEIPGMKQGPWTDVYALAASVYFAIMGKTPPPSVGRLLNDTYVPLTKSAQGRYSEGFLAAIDRALIVRPEERTQSIPQLRDELGLGEMASGDPYMTRPLPPGMDIPPRPPAPPPFAAAPGATPTSAPAPRPASAAVAAAPAAAAAAPRKNGKLIAIGAAVIVLGGLAVGAYELLAPAPRPAPAPAPVAATAPAPSPAVATPPPGAAPTPAPAAAPPAATPAQAAASFDVPAEFARVVQAQSGGFNVHAEASKARLRIDIDELSFTVSADRDGFLYVLAYGSDGVLTQLYPNSEAGALKVHKGQVMKLPQPPIYFATTEPAGPAQLLVMVSAHQRDHSALDPHKEGLFRSFPTGARAQRLAAAYAGPLSIIAGKPICSGSAPCNDEFGAAVIKVETVR